MLMKKRRLWFAVTRVQRLVLDLLFMLLASAMFAGFLVLLVLLWFHHFCDGLTRATKRLVGVLSNG
jgi:hypothetical protein